MILRSMFTAVLLFGACLAQDSSQSPGSSATPQSAQPGAGQTTSPTATSPSASAQGQMNGANRIAPGSVIPVELTKSIDAKKAKTGDQVEAKVTQDLKAGNGEIIVAKDTRVIGHVTEAQARNKQQKESQLAIAFDHAVMKGGGDMQMPLSIQAVIGARNNSDNATADNQNSNQTATAGSGPATPSAGGRAGAMGSGNASAGTGTAAASNAGADSDIGANNPSATNQGQGNAPITGETKGVVGISNLKLATEANATEGSVLSSDKNNVKLDSGTLLLLRVAQ